MDGDLFGELRVTWDDARLWVQTYAPHMLSTETRFRRYVQAWNVPQKIARARRNGEFPPARTGDL